MIDLDQAASAMLSRARRGLSPTQSDRDRVLKAMSATLAAAESVAENPDSASANTQRAAGIRNGASGAQRSVAWTSRLLVASTIAASAGSAGYWVGHRAGARHAGGTPPTNIPAALSLPADPHASVSRSVSKAESQTILRRDGFGLDAVRPQHPNSARPSKGATREPPGESLEKELSALRSIERALRDGQPQLALALLRELGRTVPIGKLVEEREATTAIARCAVGDTPFDVDLAEDFAARHPGSAYLKRVTEACASVGKPGAGRK